MVGSTAEFFGQSGDKAAGMLPNYNYAKIGLMAPVTAGASLLGGEASFAALADSAGLRGVTAALSDTLGTLHTTFGSLTGSKIVDSALSSKGSTSTAGALYPNRSNNSLMQFTYIKPGK